MYTQSLKIRVNHKKNTMCKEYALHPCESKEIESFTTTFGRRRKATGMRVVSIMRLHGQYILINWYNRREVKIFIADPLGEPSEFWTEHKDCLFWDEKSRAEFKLMFFK